MTSDSADCGGAASRCCSRWLKSVKSGIVNYWEAPGSRAGATGAEVEVCILTALLFFLFNQENLFNPR